MTAHRDETATRRRLPQLHELIVRRRREEPGICGPRDVRDAAIMAHQTLVEL